MNGGSEKAPVLFWAHLFETGSTRWILRFGQHPKLTSFANYLIQTYVVKYRSNIPSTIGQPTHPSCRNVRFHSDSTQNVHHLAQEFLYL